MDDKTATVDYLIKAANEHAAAGVRREPPSLERFQRTQELRIRFLFPQLTEIQRRCLIHLYAVRLALTILCNTPPEEFRVDPELEPLASSVERKFMNLKSAVQNSGLMSSLSVVQRQLLE